MRNVFGYDPLLEGETGVYIVCDDSSIVRNINRMIKKSGILSVVDTAGRTHYLVDGRRNGDVTAESVSSLLINSKSLSDFKTGRKSAGLDTMICSVLDRFQVDRKYYGYRLIGNIIKHRYLMRDSEKANAQTMYKMAADDFRITYDQVERNIRYAIKKSLVSKLSFRGYKAINYLYEILLVDIENLPKETLREEYVNQDINSLNSSLNEVPYLF